IYLTQPPSANFGKNRTKSRINVAYRASLDASILSKVPMIWGDQNILKTTETTTSYVPPTPPLNA
ncbi:unnamed protein product, partial [Rotaria magnacalcarata]